MTSNQENQREEWEKRFDEKFGLGLQGAMYEDDWIGVGIKDFIHSLLSSRTKATAQRIVEMADKLRKELLTLNSQLNDGKHILFPDVYNDALSDLQEKIMHLPAFEEKDNGKRLAYEAAINRVLKKYERN